jgi:hypothetical protein
VRGTRPIGLSLVKLLARPDDFDGQFVQVCGFYCHDFEGTALYLHREDCEHGLSKNALWVNGVIPSPVEGDSPFHMKYVLLEATFSAQLHGHFGLFSGTLLDVKRMVENTRVRPAAR